MNFIKRDFKMLDDMVDWFVPAFILTIIIISVDKV